MRAFRFRELLCMIALFVTNRYYGCGREVESTIFQCLGVNWNDWMRIGFL